jgi:hypothetical protein
MGFNATRRYRDEKKADVRLLVAAVVVIGGLLAWGFGLI